MTSLVKKMVLGATLGASVLTAAAPAEAQRYYRHRDRDNTGTAIVAGIAGLAIGAALASSSSNRRYDRGYYYDGYDPYYRNGYYPRSYYRDDYRRYRGYERCTTRRVYDPYLDRRVRVRYCR